MTGRARVIAAGVLVVLAVGGYRWWTSPERQIRRALDQIARAVSHQGERGGVQGLGALTALQRVIAEDVVVEPGAPYGPIVSRPAVVNAAARLRGGTAALRLEFLDVKITVSGETASVGAVVKVTAREPGGQDSADVREVEMTFSVVNGAWTLKRARALDALESVS